MSELRRAMTCPLCSPKCQRRVYLCRLLWRGAPAGGLSAAPSTTGACRQLARMFARRARRRTVTTGPWTSSPSSARSFISVGRKSSCRGRTRATRSRRSPGVGGTASGRREQSVRSLRRAHAPSRVRMRRTRPPPSVPARDYPQRHHLRVRDVGDLAANRADPQRSQRHGFHRTLRIPRVDRDGVAEPDCFADRRHCQDEVI
jgi:hypothetical protein